jgi:hypothetical protein
MKRIVLAAVTCLSLAVAIPAVSAAHSSGHHAGRDQRPDGHGDRRGDGHRDRERRDRLEHFRGQPTGTAGVVRSLQNGVLTITRPDGSDDENNDPSCVAMLHQPGTTVRDAELSVAQGSAIWHEIELGA